MGRSIGGERKISSADVECVNPTPHRPVAGVPFLRLPVRPAPIILLNEPRSSRPPSSFVAVTFLAGGGGRGSAARAFLDRGREPTPIVLSPESRSSSGEGAAPSPIVLL